VLVALPVLRVVLVFAALSMGSPTLVLALCLRSRVLVRALCLRSRVLVRALRLRRGILRVWRRVVGVLRLCVLRLRRRLVVARRLWRLLVLVPARISALRLRGLSAPVASIATERGRRRVRGLRRIGGPWARMQRSGLMRGGFARMGRGHSRVHRLRTHRYRMRKLGRPAAGSVDR